MYTSIEHVAHCYNHSMSESIICVILCKAVSQWDVNLDFDWQEKEKEKGREKEKKKDGANGKKQNV